ncbi:MAG: sensor histidine kinase [Archangium sp.]
MTSTPQPTASGRVWVVDDSPAEAQRTQTLLAKFYEVETFHEGASLLERLATDAGPDLILLDWQMPGVSGLDTCRFIRERRDEVSLPILMLTVRGSRQDMTSALAVGANDYVAKPYDDAELLARVRTLVRIRQQGVATQRLASELVFLSEAVPVQMFTAGLDGAFSWVSRQMTEYYGVPSEQLLGEGWMRFVHPDDLANVRQQWLEAVKNEQPYEASLRLRHGERGNFRWHLMRAVPFRENGKKTIKYYGSQADVHHLRETQTQLETRNAELDRFAYMASHDLKAPLRAFASLLQFVKDDLGDDAPPTVNENLRLMDSRVERMHLLVDALLNYSRTVNGPRDDVQSVDLEALLRDVIAMVDNPQRVDIELALPFPRLDCSPTGLRQAMQNLLTNAIKYGSPNKQPVTVRATESSGIVTIEVIDRGPGIPEAQQSRVWELFQRMSDDPSSSGVGLAIVRGMVHRMGGTVAVESKEGEGSRFLIRLPSSPR